MIPGLRRVVIENLRQVQFGKEELAYLGLTGKLEVPFQEKLAWKLYGWAMTQGLIATKEWSQKPNIHADIAILDKGEPAAILELKAMVTSDPLREIRTKDRAFDELRKDLARWSYLTNVDILGILIAAHRMKSVAPDWVRWKAVKYVTGDVTVLKRLGNETAILAACDSRVREFFRDSKVDRLEILGGEAFGTPVNAAVWVVGG